VPKRPKVMELPTHLWFQNIKCGGSCAKFNGLTPQYDFPNLPRLNKAKADLTGQAG